MFFSKDPAFTPTLIAQSWSLAALITSFILSLEPIFPGLILKQLAPDFADSIEKILKLLDFADLASDELTGGYDILKGERIKIKGYLEDFALSKNEADELIMSARNKIYKDWVMKNGKQKKINDFRKYKKTNW